ncbi:MULTISPECIES: hypothetical protein [Micromonospora]|uniref:Glycogen debranching protein n=1 Tax=Micromonospora sicca TaxID=2202420 RepID=A0A317D062_9ACTN|nr:MULTISPECIES: hypothetical protein [unclassified Micromonospora]MBM0224271.1 hypothetical protein [Micromonospora sp. ATA51]PWR07997.1 hypothetical protein DKT69_33510 [Micromonospora sp. 4G51]
MSAICALLLVGALLPALNPAAAAESAAHGLTNLDHLDFLYDTVKPPSQEGHTTYRLAEEPEFGVVWVYAQHNSDGGYTRAGGGSYDADSDTWGQGAYYPGDATRAAVAYLRHWRIREDQHSLDRAYQLLRGAAYMQEAGGANLGNFEQWMQPDGRINRQSVPFDGNSDRESYANARAIWAFGEAYDVFKDRDPGFARFLQDRLVLSFDSLDRQSLNRYGQYHIVDGLKWPSWFLGKYGVNSTADLMQGLVAYVHSTEDAEDASTRQVHDRAQHMLAQYGEALNEMSLGDAYQWPFGAMMNNAAYRAHWAGWGNMMAGSLAEAGALLGRRDWINTAVASVSTFTPHMMIQGGPDNQWSPAPVGRIQFGFSADDLVQSLYQVAVAADRPGIRALAGYAASWYFGNNYAGRAMYNPDNGVLFDGLTGDGYINTNSGAEVSHALMSMELLDQNPDLARRALTAKPMQRHTWRMVEAESGKLSGAATVSDPCPFLSGEGQCSGRSVTLDPGGRIDVTVELPANGEYLVLPVVNREQVPKGELGLGITADGAPLATVDLGGAGDRGVTSRPGYPDIVTAQAVTVRQNRLALSFTHEGASDHPIAFDAVLVQPLVEVQTVGDSTSAQALLRSFSRQFETREVSLPTDKLVIARAYDVSGRLVRTVVGRSGTVEAPVAPGGFTLVSSGA